MSHPGPAWREVLEDLWRLNRVHVGSDMSEACVRLAAAYDGSRVFGYSTGDTSGSWTVPDAWEVQSGRLFGPDGEVLADWADHPLALFAFSPPFRGEVTRAQLESHQTAQRSESNFLSVTDFTCARRCFV